MKSKQKTKYVMPKEDFITFLASATPDEINQYIQEKGKPRKLFCPLIYCPKTTKEDNKNEYCERPY